MADLRRYGLLALLVAALLVLVAQTMLPASEIEPSPEAPDSRAVPVTLMTLQIEEQIEVTRRFVGRIEAKGTAELSFEYGGTIDELAVREGDLVRAGDRLARVRGTALTVERETLGASRAALQNRFALLQAEADRVAQLVERGVAPGTSLDPIKAELYALEASLAEADGALAQLDLRLQAADLVAPFDAVVGATAVALGETVAPGQPVLTLFQTGGVTLRVGLPTQLDPAALRAPRVAINGEVFAATLSALRPDIDPRSNLRIALFDVATPEVGIVGITATLQAEVSLPEHGAWVPMDALRPSAEGYWIVLGVSDTLVAERIAVEIQHLREDEAFIIGAFETGTRIISGGAHKVVPGQTVRVD